MSQDDLAARLDAVERRLDAAYPEPADGAVDAIERIEAFAERLADLEAAVEAVEGYVGEIERVDDELERRADAALAATDGLEDRLDAVDERLARDGRGGSGDLDDRLAEQAATLDELQRIADDLDDRLATIEDEPARSPADSAQRSDGDPGWPAAPNEQSRLCDCEEPLGEASTTGAIAPSSGSPRSTTDGGVEQPGDRTQSTGRSGPAGDGPAERSPSQQRDSIAGEGRTEAATNVPAGPDTDTPADSDELSHANADRSQTARMQTDRLRADRQQTDGQQADHSSPARSQRTSAPEVGADGGRTSQEPSASSTITGWGDPSTDAAEGHEDGSRSRPDASPDRRWAEPGTETLLDRLRSLL